MMGIKGTERVTGKIVALKDHDQEDLREIVAHNFRSNYVGQVAVHNTESHSLRRHMDDVPPLYPYIPPEVQATNTPSQSPSANQSPPLKTIDQDLSESPSTSPSHTPQKGGTKDIPSVESTKSIAWRLNSQGVSFITFIGIMLMF